MRLYLFDKFGEEKGIDMMVEVYKQMPFITDAKRIDANSIRLWLNDMSPDVAFVITQRNFQDWGAWMRVKSAEELIMSLEIKAMRMVKALFDGRLVMNSGFPLSSGVECLFPIADALRNAGTETEFLERIPDSLRQRGILERDLKNFWKHREQAPVWEAWAKQIYEEDLEAHLSYEVGLVALDPFIRAASSADGLLATLQVKRPRLFRRILGEDSKGNFNYSNGLFGEYELREFFKNRNNPEGWRPKPLPPSPPYKPPSEIIETISAALEKAETETEFRAALDGKFTDTDWRGGAATWDKYFTFIWERRNRPRHEWSGEPSSPPVTYTNAPSQGPDFDW